jgi:hypothetical protein
MPSAPFLPRKDACSYARCSCAASFSPEQPVGLVGVDGLDDPVRDPAQVGQGQRLGVGQQVGLGGLGAAVRDLVGEVVEGGGDGFGSVAVDLPARPGQTRRLCSGGHCPSVGQGDGRRAWRHVVPADEPRLGRRRPGALGDAGVVGLRGQPGDHLLPGAAGAQGGGQARVGLGVGERGEVAAGEGGVEGGDLVEGGDDVVRAGARRGRGRGWGLGRHGLVNVTEARRQNRPKRASIWVFGRKSSKKLLTHE